MLILVSSPSADTVKSLPSKRGDELPQNGKGKFQSVLVDGLQAGGTPQEEVDAPLSPETDVLSGSLHELLSRSSLNVGTDGADSYVTELADESMANVDVELPVGDLPKEPTEQLEAKIGEFPIEQIEFAGQLQDGLAQVLDANDMLKATSAEKADVDPTVLNATLQAGVGSEGLLAPYAAQTIQKTQQGAELQNHRAVKLSTLSSQTLPTQSATANDNGIQAVATGVSTETKLSIEAELAIEATQQDGERPLPKQAELKAFVEMPLKTSSPSLDIASTSAPKTAVSAFSANIQTLVDAVRENSSWTKHLTAPAATVTTFVKPGGEVLQALKIQLNPIELGKIELHMRMSQGQMEIEIRTETQQAFANLSADKEGLMTTLKALGYKVENMSIVAPNASAHPQYQSSEYSNNQQFHEEREDTNRSKHDERYNGSDDITDAQVAVVELDAAVSNII